MTRSIPAPNALEVERNKARSLGVVYDEYAGYKASIGLSALQNQKPAAPTTVSATQSSSAANHSKGNHH